MRGDDGAVWLFWLENGQVMRQRLDLDTPGDAQALTSAVSLAPGDQLIDVRAALDRSGAYFFWNITRADGRNETWFTAGALDARAWRQPQRLRIDVSASTTATAEASPAARAFDLRWVAPLAGQADTLAAAAESDAGLALLELSGGVLVGYRMVVPGVHLLGIPALVQDDAGDLDLAWSAPGDSAANLNVLVIPKSS